MVEKEWNLGSEDLHLRTFKNCVSVGSLLNHPELWFSHLYNGTPPPPAPTIWTAHPHRVIGSFIAESLLSSCSCPNRGLQKVLGRVGS